MCTQQWLFQLTPDRKSLPQFFGRSCIQSESVVKQTVAQHTFDPGHAHGGGACGLVGVVDGGRPQHPLPLRKHPVPHFRVSTALQWDASDTDATLCVAHDVQIQMLQRDLAELTLHGRSRSQRQGDSPQVQLHFARCIQNLHMIQFKLRHQAM